MGLSVYCWLRDAYFSLTAFHNLGHFEEMEGFLKFLLNIAYTHEHSRERLAPVYTLSQDLPLPETEQRNWAGFCKSAPVRLLSEHFVPDTRAQLGNFPQAYSHVGLINAAFAVSPPWNSVL